MKLIHPSRMRFGAINPLTDNFIFNLNKCNNNVESAIADDVIGDKKCIAIYAGPVAKDRNMLFVNLPASFYATYIKRVYCPGTIILFDNSLEGQTQDEFKLIHEIVDLLPDVISSNVIYLTGAINVTDIYQEFCKDNNISRCITPISGTAWEKRTVRNMMQISYESVIKPKKFLCFNRISKPHRLMTVCSLAKLNLLPESYVSYFPQNTWFNTNTSIDQVLLNLRYKLNDHEYYHEIENTFNQISNLFPMKLNIEPDFNKIWIDESDLQLYSTSYISLVTETCYFKNDLDHHIDTIFFSEKIFKPIAMMHPFILITRPYSLRFLRNLGYKTFAPFINESYDDIENDIERFKAIHDEIARLGMLTNDEWITFQQNIKSIVEYNFDVLKNKSIFITR